MLLSLHSFWWYIFNCLFSPKLRPCSLWPGLLDVITAWGSWTQWPPQPAEQGTELGTEQGGMSGARGSVQHHASLDHREEKSQHCTMLTIFRIIRSVQGCDSNASQFVYLHITTPGRLLTGSPMYLQCFHLFLLFMFWYETVQVYSKIKINSTQIK